MQIARDVASRATCLKRAVGCVLTDAYGDILATGYNGVAAGVPHCNEVTNADMYIGSRVYGGSQPPEGPHSGMPYVCKDYHKPPGQDCCEAVHAEQNSLIKCKFPRDIYTCYVTLEPCLACTKMLLSTGCMRVVFDKPWDGKGKELFLRSRNGAAGKIRTDAYWAQLSASPPSA